MTRNIDLLASHPFPSLAVVARLGPKPTMLYHLHKEGERYVMKYKIPVVEGHRPLTTHVPYDMLDIEASKAIALLVSGANGHNLDLTKHPWALHSIWRLMAPQGLIVILEWQPASTGPQAVTIGNVTPVRGSSTTVVVPFMSSGVAEASETASILYVLQCVIMPEANTCQYPAP